MAVTECFLPSGINVSQHIPFPATGTFPAFSKKSQYIYIRHPSIRSALPSHEIHHILCASDNKESIEIPISNLLSVFSSSYKIPL